MTPDQQSPDKHPLNLSFMRHSAQVLYKIFVDERAQSFSNWMKLPSEIRRMEVECWRKLGDRAVSAFEQCIVLRYRELGIASALEPTQRSVLDYSSFEEWKALFIELQRRNSVRITAKNAGRVRIELIENIARIGAVFGKNASRPVYNGVPMARMMDGSLLYLRVKPRSDGVAVGNIVCCLREAANPMIEHVGLHGILTIDSQPLSSADAIAVATELERHVRAFQL